MDDNSQSIPLVSPTMARAVWIIAVALAGFVLTLTLWGWARRGYAWTTFLGPVGLLFLVASHSIIRSRTRLYLVFQVIGLSLLVASTVLVLRTG